MSASLTATTPTSSPKPTRSPTRRGGGVAFLYLVPALAVFGLFMFYPLIRSVILSFQGTDIIGKPNGFVGGDNYSRMFSDPGTGYFPISKGALNEAVDVAYRAKNPLFDVAVKQLEGTPLNTATQGCALGVMPQSRKASEDAIEKILNGSDPQQSLTAAATGLQEGIKQYNASVK